MLILKVEVFIQCQVVIIVSTPWSKKINIGSRLTTNAVLTAVLTWVTAQSGFLGAGLIVVIRGYARRAKISTSDDVSISVVCIALAWICTKSFWFLRPTDSCYSSKAE